MEDLEKWNKLNFGELNPKAISVWTTSLKTSVLQIVQKISKQIRWGVNLQITWGVNL